MEEGKEGEFLTAIESFVGKYLSLDWQKVSNMEWNLPMIEVQQDPRLTGVRSKKKPKKRKITGHLEYQFHHIPKILKRDIRRQYAIMFANVHNSVDYELMNNFISDFCRIDTTLNITRSGLVCDRNEFSGFNTCGQVWYTGMQEAPDLTFTLTSNRIKLRSDGTGVVMGDFEMTGTKPLYLDEIAYQKLSNVISASESEISISFQSSDEDHSIKTNSSTSSSNICKDLPKLDCIANTFNPCSIHQLTMDSELNYRDASRSQMWEMIKFKYTGQLSLHFDSDSKIFYIDFSMKL